jgi:hypothetical protein
LTDLSDLTGLADLTGLSGLADLAGLSGLADLADLLNRVAQLGQPAIGGEKSIPDRWPPPPPG